MVGNGGLSSHVLILLLFGDADTSPSYFKESRTGTNIAVLNFLLSPPICCSYLLLSVTGLFSSSLHEAWLRLLICLLKPAKQSR